MDLRLRVRFAPGTTAYTIQAQTGTYFTSGASANLQSTVRTTINYAMPAAAGSYAYLSGASLLIYTPNAGSVAVPERLWQGQTTPLGVRLSIWPPANGTVPDSYKLYRQDLGPSNPVFTGMVPRAFGTGAPVLHICQTDATVSPNTTYTYYATAIYGTTESGPSPTLTVTTPALTGFPVAPAAPTPPESFIPPYALPTGTVWTATQNAAGNANSPGTGAKQNVGCGFNFALTSPNLQSGDVIVLTAGALYTMNGNTNSCAFSIPTSASGIYIISSEDPVYKVGGLLPAYSYYTDVRYQSYSATAGIAANATSLTLTAAFQGRTGWYTTQFASTNPSGIETRQALFQNASTAVTWNVGLQAACSATFDVCVGNWATPWDAGYPIGPGNVTNGSPSMPILRFLGVGSGTQTNGMQVLASNIRFVGIAIEPTPSYVVLGGMTTCISTSASATGIMFDRCLVGRESTASTLSYYVRSVSTASDSTVYHQCYIYGADGGQSTTGSVGDSSGISNFGGGPLCVQNCYLEAGDENYISGGNFVAQSELQHDVTIRHCMSHKPTAWQQVLDANGFSTSRRIKNHLENKCCVRYEFYGNILQNDALLQGSQGQGARAFVLTPRDQISATATQQLNGISCVGTLATATTKFAMPFSSPTQFYTTISGAGVAGYNGTWTCSAISSTQFTFTVPVNLAATGLCNYQRTARFGGMWQNVTDGNYHDNQVYGVGCLINIWSNMDYNPTLYSARIRCHNNIIWLNPAMTDDLNNKTNQLVTFSIQGQPIDVEFTNNTSVYRPDNTGYATGVTTGIFSFQQGPSQTLQYRWRVANNIFDGTAGGNITTPANINPPNAGSTGLQMENATWDSTSRLFDRNLFIKDTSSGANAWTNTGGSMNPIAYGSIGFSNFIDNVTQPATPADWNVVGATYSVAATDGGPLGSYFLGPPLADDLFPRLSLMVIAPSGTTYANSTFQALAGQFNIVIFGPYMGLEQAQGATFATIFKAIRATGKANGIYTRCLHYTMSSELAKSAGSGNANTYTQWINSVNTANWWLRVAPYPTGTIVASSDGQTNTGTLQTSINNTVVDSGGRTIFQKYWDHYDGVLRLGNAVSQGYASGVANALNPYIDGYEMDNTFCTPRVTGAWANNSTQYTSHWPNSADPQIATWLQQGLAQHIAAFRAAWPLGVLLCNSDYYIHAAGTAFSYAVTLDPSLKNTMDIVFCEQAIGVGGIEGAPATTTAQFMSVLTSSEAQMTAQGTQILAQNGVSYGVNFSNTSQASWTATDWKGARFGMAMACMRNWHFGLTNSANQYSPTTIYQMDEFGVTASGTQTRGRNYLGRPIDPPQTAARTSGVWWRQFEHGVVFMNPKGNGSQTLNLTTMGLTGFSALQNIGFGDATINTGLAVTSITLADRDGRFLAS